MIPEALKQINALPGLYFFYHFLLRGCFCLPNESRTLTKELLEVPIVELVDGLATYASFFSNIGEAVFVGLQAFEQELEREAALFRNSVVLCFSSLHSGMCKREGLHIHVDLLGRTSGYSKT